MIESTNANLNPIRRLINNQPQIILFALVYLTDPQGNLLLLRSVQDENYWQLPGGTLQTGESMEQCLQRAVYHSLGTMIERSEQVHLFSDPSQRFQNEEGRFIYPVYQTFLPLKTRGSLQLAAEIVREVRFFATWNVLLEQIYPPQRQTVAFFLEKFPGGVMDRSYNLFRD